jgi:hypothetical protein
MSAAPALAPGLARKVKKVLETRTDGAEVTDALKALSGFFTTNTPAARRGALPRACLRAVRAACPRALTLSPPPHACRSACGDRPPRTAHQ